jgi:hypothetical protein
VIELPVRRPQRYPSLERLICAAISNRRFAEHLLRSPKDALDTSTFVGQLSDEERALIVSITGARDIHDFAAQLHAKVQPRS